MRRLLFHLRRTVRDLRRGGVRVLVRKLRRIPAALRGSGPFRLARGLADLVVLFGLAVRNRRGTHGRDWILERLQLLRMAASTARRDEVDAIVRRVRASVSVGRLAEARETLEAVPTRVVRDPRILHERSQVHYLHGEWTEAVAAKIDEVRARDEEVSGSWLGRLGARFVSGAFIGHIGHLGLIDLVVKARELGLLSPEPRQVVARRESVANVPYLECWRPHVGIAYVDVEQYRAFEAAMRPLFDDVSVVRLRSGLTDFYSAYASVNERWRLEGRGPLLVPDPGVVARGREVLARHGLDPEGWFVGLHVREGDPHWWTNAVDADPSSYAPMIESIAAVGGTVVRMGSPETTPLPRMKGCIDYAHLPVRSAEADVALWSQCRFFVGTGSGPMNVPHTFGRPSILTNMPAIGLDQGFDAHLVLPKLVVDGGGAPVPFDEVVQSRFGWGISRSHAGSDWRFVDNDAEDLVAAAGEMLRLTGGDGAWSVTPRQRQVADRLHALGRTGRSAFPESFLERHAAAVPSVPR